jgi:hypothetical protein
MKSALLLSGELRDFEYCWESIKKYMCDPFDTDVYIHTWTKPTNCARYMQAPAFVDMSPVDFIESVVKPKNYLMEDYDSNWYDHRRPIFRTAAPMYYSVWKSYQLIKDSGIDYDIVIRTRMDNEHYDYIGEEYINKAINDDVLFVEATSSKDYLCLEPDGSQSWCRSNLPHVPDTFAFGNMKNMEAYSDLYPNIDDYFEELLMAGKTMFFAEELLGHHLWTRNKLNIERCNIKYAFLMEWNKQVRIHKEWI